MHQPHGHRAAATTCLTPSGPALLSVAGLGSGRFSLSMVTWFPSSQRWEPVCVPICESSNRQGLLDLRDGSW